MHRMVGSLMLGVVLLGCGRSVDGNPVLLPPLFLAVAYDVTGSVEETKVPVLTKAEVDRLLNLVKARGGGMTFGVIDEQAFRLLSRVELKRVAGRLDDRARLNLQNQEEQGKFRAEVASQLSRPRNARRTDIKGAIARLSLFFTEPTIPAGATKVALFISDGIDTAHWREVGRVRLPADVRVYVVGMERGLARRWFGEQAVLFESPEAVIRALGQEGRR